MADAKKKTYISVVMAGEPSENDTLLRRYRDAKAVESRAKAVTEELRDTILGRCWRDEFVPLLKAQDADGLEIKDADGRPAVRIAVGFPVRFQGKELERDDPQLYARYKRASDKPETRVTLVGDDA